MRSNMLRAGTGAVTATVLAVAALVAMPALAHHSRSNFDLDSTVEVEGTVTEFAWNNPHAFAVVEGKKGTARPRSGHSSSTRRRCSRALVGRLAR